MPPWTFPCSSSEKPQPLLDGSNQRPLWSTSLMTPETMKGWIGHVPCVVPIVHDKSASSGWRTVSFTVPTCVGSALRPLTQLCLRSAHVSPTVAILPCAVYHVGCPRLS